MYLKQNVIKNAIEVLENYEEYDFKGDIKVIDDFWMPQFDRKRRVWLYLPPDYQENKNKHYPVFYMQDGENLFSDRMSFAGSWGVSQILEEYFYQGKIDGIIVVGIENGKEYREEEYTPWHRLKDYVDFIAETLKPFIDEKLRTKKEREYTGIGGSSFGGIASLYAGLMRQDVFSKIGGFSPSAWEWREKIGTEVFRQKEMRIYLSVGEMESDDSDEAKQGGAKAFLKQTIDIYDRLELAGFREEEKKLFVDKNGKHNEKTWHRHFREAILWLYEKGGNKKTCREN